MTNERSSLVVEREYATALGLAMFAFASAEWDAIWCCERIEAGSIEDLDDRTAGNVADRLLHLAATLPNSRDQQRLSSAADQFQELVRVRNALFHAKPQPSGDTNVLSRKGDPWTLEEIDAAADQFTKCSDALNDLLHSFLTKSV